jgi:hypothetical protein
MTRRWWVVSGTVVLAACTPSIVASSVTSAGEVVQGKLEEGARFPDDNVDVIARSAAHDLPCTAADVRVTRNRDLWMGEGCGGRAVYNEACLKMGQGDPAEWTGRETKLPLDTDIVCRVKLLGRTRL